MDVVIVGAGTFGASLAWWLARAGEQVTLVDQFEPGDRRASSGGETRLYRCAHGPDADYTAMARRARTLWHELEDESGDALLVECGMAWFAHRDDGWEAASERTLAGQGIPAERLEVARAARLYPSFRGDDLAFVLLEPEGGVLRAERSVRALVKQAVAHGARIVRARARPDGAAVVLDDGTRLAGDIVVWACGPWLAHLFEDLISLTVTQQELLFLDGGPAWRAPGLPGWCDYERSRYGTGDIDALGIKAAIDDEGHHSTPTPSSRARRTLSPRSAPTCVSAFLPLRTRPSSELARADTSSHPTLVSSPRRTPPIRTSGLSEGARVTASSTVRRWPNVSPPPSPREPRCRPTSD